MDPIPTHISVSQMSHLSHLPIIWQAYSTYFQPLQVSGGRIRHERGESTNEAVIRLHREFGKGKAPKKTSSPGGKDVFLSSMCCSRAAVTTASWIPTVITRLRRSGQPQRPRGQPG